MAVDSKDSIAEAAQRLLIGNKIIKLTVKNIVEECHITRQAFYGSGQRRMTKIWKPLSIRYIC